ncbi:unnamed protein product [Arabis nemorensis]|uniref:Uncharacterized protein n=1 Tax=Arabis nemorensis TaxID=586526 RepID=A0A565C621_9BRAS|nr:unnamed protein product [Arabis nemorensis]
MEKFSLLFSLPESLQISIAILVAKSGATQLRPLIVSRRQGYELAFHSNVLRAESLDYPAVTPILVNEDSTFRSFICRCALARNPNAFYLESLRLTIQYGALEKSAQLLRNIVAPSQKMSFAFALILFSSHRYNEAVAVMNKFKEVAGSFDEDVFVCQCVYWDIESIGPLNRVLFTTTWQQYMLFPPN